MKFARIGAAGKERPVVVVDGAYFDISSITPDIDGRFLESEGCGRVAEAVRDGSFPKLGGVLVVMPKRLRADECQVLERLRHHDPLIS